MASRTVAAQVGLILAGTSFIPLGTVALGLLLPLIRDDLGLSYAEAGSLAAASTLVYALMQVPAGMLADRFGPRPLYVIGTLVTSLLTIAFAASSSYLQAITVQLVSGVSRAMAFAPGLVLVATWFAPRRRATAMSLFIGAGLAWGVVVSIVGPSAAAATDWRTVLAGFASIGVVVALTLALVGRTGPEARTHGPADPEPVGLARLMRRPAMWLVGVIQFTRLAVVQGIALWLPTFLVDERDLPLTLVGGIVAAMAVAATPANLIGGYVADRTGRPYLVIGVALATLAVALVALGAEIVPVVVLAIAAIAFAQQLYFGPLFAAPVAIFGPRSAGLVSGAANLFANLGAFAAGLGLGIITDLTGSLVPGFLVMAGMCGIAIVATLRLRGLAAVSTPAVVESVPPPARSPAR